jgi:hypothetical protein
MLNLILHPYSIWHADGQYSGRFSNLECAARRVEFYGRVEKGKVGDRGWFANCDVTGQFWDYAQCLKIVQEAKYSKTEEAAA